MQLSPTASIETNIFDKITKGNDRLKSPVAKDFDPLKWEIALQHAHEERDQRLGQAAFWIAGQVQSLRMRDITELFSGISRKSAVILAVASANRNLFRVSQAIKDRKPADESTSTHISELNDQGIKGFGEQELSADDITTVLVDTLPHWFFETKNLPSQRESKNFDYRSLELNGTYALSFLEGLRDIWMAALWEGHHFRETDVGLAFGPANKKEAFYWKACQMRAETAMYAPLFRPSCINSDNQIEDLEGIIGVRRERGKIKYKFGPVDKRRARSLYNTVSILEASYLSAFLDVPLENTKDVTLRDLVKALWILEGISIERYKFLKKKVFSSYRSVSDLACRIEISKLTSIFERTLGVPNSKAVAIVDSLRLSPDDTTACFRDGLWQRPLVDIGDAEVAIVAPSVINGAKVRFCERRIFGSSGGEVKKTSPQGIAFENAIRADTDAALSNNPYVRDFYILPYALKRSSPNGEEIDLLVRIGETVIVVEAKCFIAPNEPIERHNYKRKLEDASEQVLRKVGWAQNNSTKVAELLKFGGNHRMLSFVPLVIINHRMGSGIEVNGVTICDAYFWKLLLSDNGYTSASAITKDKEVPVITELYATESGLIDFIKHEFPRMPPLQPFLKAEKWEKMAFPTTSGKPIQLDRARLLPNALITPELNAATEILLEQN
jgi:hypothetical protein